MFLNTFTNEIAKVGFAHTYSSLLLLTVAPPSAYCPELQFILSFSTLNTFHSFTANKGDNYSLSTFRRLEASTFTHIVVVENITCFILHLTFPLSL